MGLNFKASTALFLTFNLIFFVLASSSRHPSNGVGRLLNEIGGNYDDNSQEYSPSSSPVVVSPSGGQSGNCGTLNLGVCLNVLGGLLNLEVGNVPSEPCCSLIKGLVDLEAAVCLCTAIKADVLGIIKLDLPISLNLLLNDCGRGNSTQYICSP